jgi:DeoR/GlpR family transcriptional regulator of sugar metabolism
VIILDLLQQQQVIAIQDICTHCDCSPITARRDLAHLEEQGLLRRTHGGAMQRVHATKPTSIVVSTGVLEARAALVDRSDALIVTPARTSTTDLLARRALRAHIPIIAEAIPYQGAVTTVAIDDYGAGTDMGHWVGDYVRTHLSEKAAILDVTASLPNVTARSRGFADGLRDMLGGRFALTRVDGQGVREQARAVAADALVVYPDTRIIFGINDDSALGALDAYRDAGLDERHLLLVSCGLEGKTTRDLLADRGPYRAAVAMFPEIVGRACVEAAACAYHGCPLPERLVTPHAVVTADGLDQYYLRDERTGSWSMHRAALHRLVTSGLGLPLLEDCHGRAQPLRLGVVQVFSSHEWYQNVRRSIQEHCQAQAIRLEVIDASQDLDEEIDRLNRAIGIAAAASVVAGDTIILDSGKATTYLAAALRGRDAITVITNSLRVLTELADERGIRLIASGGVVRGQSRSLIGHGAEEVFQEIRANKAFMTGTGFSLEFGLSDTSTSELGVKQAMVSAAREVFLLADHTAIGVESLVKVAPSTAIQRLITDAGISAHDRTALTQRGIEVIVADERG